ncbi:uncharacterized protein LOC6564581 [Drosophila grimshawi]|uniref:GH11931 n=1 Tax=Drosophila grimshawi TaxID=7222 RepID=B4JL51_DROGR|nr:uncharacterized protein LOC6564581 [Drosophila grimshawi]EDW00304.1 GH11931 [Drosophila grimshawi]
MGCDWSKALDSDVQTNTLQQLQAAEATPRAKLRRRQEKKRQRQLAKLQKRNARKRRHQQTVSGGDSRCGKAVNRLPRGSVSLRGSHNLAPQLRLFGGSNGSSATECVSALYARTLEQLREEHQRTIEHKTRHQLERQLHTFLLNQLLLGMQFFGHFEHEMAAIDEQLLARQRNSAQTLTEHSLLHASAIDEAVAKRLLFNPTAGPQRQFGATSGKAHSPPQPLQRMLTYVVFDNVDVARANDANYDSIAALCKVLLETDYYNTTPCRRQYVRLLEQSRWLGYVRLKLREPTPTQQQRRISSPSSPSSDEGGDIDTGVYTDGSSGYSTGNGTAASLASGSVAGSWREGDYDHVYIARLNTQRPMDELTLKLERDALQRNVLPEACVCRLASCLPAWLEQSDDDDDDNEDDDDDDDDGGDDVNSGSDAGAKDQQDEDQQQQRTESNRSGYETVQILRQCRVEQHRRRALLQQCYLSSEQFMNYFGELLRQQLAPELGISQKQLSAGSYRGCTIYTATEELVPAIHVPHTWPDCAFEFNLRARPQLTNVHTGDKQEWPTMLMRKRIQTFGYHVVPVGYTPKRSRNPFRELEWRIVFPQAELYLERQLTRMQLKVLMLMKALVRTFMNDKCQAMGHIMEQLRTHLFWQCERHSNDWPDEFLGEQLIRFVRTFADCLAKKQLSDFFIERRNLFEHVPEDALMELRSIMAGIAEQPLVHLLQALRNLQHADDFYPKLNYERLLENLVTPDYLQLRSWAKFARTQLPAVKQEQLEQLTAQVERRASSAEGLLGMRMHQERTRGKLRRKTHMLRAQQLKQLAEQRRCSEDSLHACRDMPLLMRRASQTSQTSSRSSIKSEGRPQLNDGIEILRRTNLLELLLDHMLAMLAKAAEFRNAQHVQLYLEHSQRLCRLYQQLGCTQYAKYYAEALCQAASGFERATTRCSGNSNTNPSPSRSGSPSPSLRVSVSSSCHSSPMRRKSLKFVEHVVQMHTGDIMPLQSGSTATLSTTRRRSSSALTLNENDIAIVDAQVEPVAEPVPTTSTDTPTKEVSQLLGTLMQRLQIDPSALQTISTKTEQLLQTLAPESRRDDLREMLKRNTQKLKSAFN